MSNEFNTPWKRFKLRVAGIVSLALPPCEVITQKQSFSLDAKPSLKDRLLIRLHLYTCVWCTRYGEHISFISQAVRRAGTEAKAGVKVRNRLSPEASQRLKNRLESGL